MRSPLRGAHKTETRVTLLPLWGPFGHILRPKGNERLIYYPGGGYHILSKWALWAERPMSQYTLQARRGLSKGAQRAAFIYPAGFGLKASEANRRVPGFRPFGVYWLYKPPLRAPFGATNPGHIAGPKGLYMPPLRGRCPSLSFAVRGPFAPQGGPFGAPERSPLGPGGQDKYALSLSPEGPGGGSGTRIPRFAGAPLGAGEKAKGPQRGKCAPKGSEASPSGFRPFGFQTKKSLPPPFSRPYGERSKTPLRQYMPKGATSPEGGKRCPLGIYCAMNGGQRSPKGTTWENIFIFKQSGT